MIKNIIIATLAFTAPNGIVNFCSERSFRKNIGVNHHVMSFSNYSQMQNNKKTKNCYEPFNSCKSGGGPNNYISKKNNFEIQEIDRRINFLKSRRTKLLKKMYN